MIPVYSSHREAALALLNSDAAISRRSGGFLGQIAVDGRPLSEKQIDYLDQLLTRAGLPLFGGDA